jgi:hypothetical protein
VPPRPHKSRRVLGNHTTATAPSTFFLTTTKQRLVKKIDCRRRICNHITQLTISCARERRKHTTPHRSPSQFAYPTSTDPTASYAPPQREHPPPARPWPRFYAEQLRITLNDVSRPTRTADPPAPRFEPHMISAVRGCRPRRRRERPLLEPDRAPHSAPTRQCLHAPPHRRPQPPPSACVPSRFGQNAPRDVVLDQLPLGPSGAPFSVCYLRSRARILSPHRTDSTNLRTPTRDGSASRLPPSHPSPRPARYVPQRRADAPRTHAPARATSYARNEGPGLVRRVPASPSEPMVPPSCICSSGSRRATTSGFDSVLPPAWVRRLAKSPCWPRTIDRPRPVPAGSP